MHTEQAWASWRVSPNFISDGATTIPPPIPNAALSAPAASPTIMQVVVSFLNLIKRL
jgi:hypothetical protein